MHESRYSTSSASAEIKAAIREAQELFAQAKAATGEKAEQLRRSALEILEAASTRAQAVQDAALEHGKKAAQSTNEFVEENPWKAVGIGALAGLLLGALIARR
jgi:ElaB/YqjD/DUF883 family membrane-anchored ribosome-binding protein